jgi:hypothetical protein
MIRQGYGRIALLFLAVAAIAAVYAAAPVAPAARVCTTTTATGGLIITRVGFDALPLEDVIQFLRDATDLNIVVRWEELQKAGVGRKTPVTVKLTNVTVEGFLNSVLQNVSPKLGFVVDDGVVTISTTADLARQATSQTTSQPSSQPTSAR